MVYKGSLRGFSSFLQDPLATLSIITLWLMALLTDDDYSRESLCLKSFILYKDVDSLCIKYFLSVIALCFLIILNRSFI